MAKLTKAQARGLCIKKWELIVKHNGRFDYEYLIKKMPELKTLLSLCAYCAIYFYRNNEELNNCAGCPLVNITKNYDYDESGCAQKNHPWQLWNKTPIPETAQAVLDLIIKSKQTNENTNRNT